MGWEGGFHDNLLIVVRIAKGEENVIDLSVKVIVGIGLFVVVVCILLLIFGKRDDDESERQIGQFPDGYSVLDEVKQLLSSYQEFV